MKIYKNMPTEPQSPRGWDVIEPMPQDADSIILRAIRQNPMITGAGLSIQLHMDLQTVRQTIVQLSSERAITPALDTGGSIWQFIPYKATQTVWL